VRELINSIFIIIFQVTAILAAAIFLYDGDCKYLMVALNMMIYSKLLMVERKLADEAERLAGES